VRNTTTTAVSRSLHRLTSVSRQELEDFVAVTFCYLHALADVFGLLWTRHRSSSHQWYLHTVTFTIL